MRKILVILVGLFTILTFSSQSVFADGRWVSGLTVDRVLSRKDGGMAFVTSPSVASATAEHCNTSSIYMTPGANGMNADGVKSAMAVVLTALSTGKTIDVYVLNNIDTCWAQEIWISK